jgi:hypothetical protein
MKISKIITAAALSVGLLGGLAAAAGPALAATSHPAAASRIVPWTVYYSDSWHPWTVSTKPANIYFGAGGSFNITRIDWSYLKYQGQSLQWWARGSAQGFGTVNINTCHPVDCAHGRVLHYTYSIIDLSRVRYHNGQAYFSRIEVFYMTPGHPDGIDLFYNLGPYGPQ